MGANGWALRRQGATLVLLFACLMGPAVGYRFSVRMAGPALPNPFAALTGAKPAKGSVGRDAIKTSLTELCRSTVGAGKKPTPAQENEVRRLAKALGGVNPTTNPAYSKGVDGNWKLLFSDSPGVSSGRLGPFTGRVYQDVDLKAKTYANILEIGDQDKPWLEARLEATWDVVDGQTWEVIFDDITVSVFGLKLLTQKFKNVKRFWVMTYLDGDLRIMLGRRPERAEDDAYVFVLSRES